MAEHSLESAFRSFKLTEAILLASEVITLGRSGKRTWKGFLRHLRGLDDDQQTRVKELALARPGSKRKAGAIQGNASKRRKLNAAPAAPASEESESGDVSDRPLFDPPSDELEKDAIARQVHRQDRKRGAEARDLYGLRVYEVLLRSGAYEAHPAHVLVDGMLLDETAASKQQTYICTQCKAKLLKDRLPPLALANGMWVGKIPFELATLTLPERLLVALYFPAVYIVKLYPRLPNARAWPKDQIANGLKGNVSTYRLHASDVAGMTSGKMPPPPKILAATIGVTFVGGKRNIPLRVLPDMFRVRRQRVFQALLWLKQNNPLYANVEISEETLRLLPENAVPDEILSNVKYSEDVHALEREQAGYIPADAADEEAAGEDDTESDDGSAMDVDVPPLEDEYEDYEPAVIPLQSHGVLDVRADSVPDSVLTAHAFANIATNVVDKNFAVRKSSEFINEYARRDEQGRRFDGGPDNANHMLGSFPVLFPYGQGGIEVDREVNVSYEAHVRWLLQYVDKRFRKDPYFVFMIFGVLQKRMVCRYAGLQIKRSSLVSNSVSFLKLTPTDFLKASAEENRRVPISNPTIRGLKKQLTSIRAKVQGTDESRVSIRAQVWGMNLWFNPPNVWVTLSFPDESDPIAQVLAGADIDLDNFVATAGPNRERRLENIVADPFASAQFFHLAVRAILEELFGIEKKTHGAPRRRPGIIGVVNAYIGTVEAQARGSLHLHILFWLKWAPSAAEMKAALQTEKFRQTIVAFLEKTIRAHIPGTTGADVLELPKVPELAYSRPEDPRRANYEQRRNRAEAAIARAVQTHKCRPTTCQRVRNGRLVCKRRAPWPVAPEPWIEPTGEWGPRRLYGLLNAWNPPLLQVTRSNQDIKLITNGQFTKDITFYITLYIAKKQNQASNASALLAKSPAFQRRYQNASADVRDLNKRMVQQCANTLSREQELSGAEIVSYLMGWGDRFISHNFVPIYWDAVSGALRHKFPFLQSNNILQRTAQQLGHVPPNGASEPPYDPPVRLRVENNELTFKDQLKEYSERGLELEDMSFLEFHVDTYDGKAVPKARKETNGGGSEQPADEAEDEQERVEDETMHSVNEEGLDESGPTCPAPHDPPPRRRGRPASRRVPYLPASGRKTCRIFRSKGLETLPHIIGRWFPPQKDKEYHCASILALLKPWRSLDDLCTSPSETFVPDFDAFMSVASHKHRKIVENIQYFHECSEAAQRSKDILPEVASGTADLQDYVRREIEQQQQDECVADLTEADVAIARQDRYAYREFLYGAGAMAVASSLGLFDEDLVCPNTGKSCGMATWDETIQYAQWGEKLKHLSKTDALVNSNPLSRPGAETDALVDDGPVGQVQEEVVELPVDSEARVRTPQQQAVLDMLNEEQRRAHDIIERHLLGTMRGEDQDQLLMIVRGEGGTGKTVLLNALADTFEFHGVSSWLAKTATTGVAASLVGGVTIHSWAGIPINAKDTPDWFGSASQKTKDKRKKNILPARYVNIDECSMLTKKLLAQLSQIIGETLASNERGQPTLPFGGMSIILFGDFHQFPPIGGPSSALYCRLNSLTQHQIGAALYTQFTTVVTLTEQIRVVDERWRDLLRRLRTGSCTEDDLTVLNTLLVSHPSCQLPDPSSPQWANAVLVTPRHGARVRWNTASLVKHCIRTGNRLYISQAEDTVGRKEEPLSLLQRVTVTGMPIKQTARLAERVELAVGMRAMVMMNIATEADLANGTRGEVIDIKLDPREQPSQWEQDTETGGILLQYPPVLVLFKPDVSKYPSFEGLEPGILPVVPTKLSFAIEPRGRKATIHRRQLAMTAAYAFTDYKSQGQTIRDVFVDLQRPPSGTLTPFSAYVALSRSRGRDNIRLLRGFDTELFTTHPSLDLEIEDRRLDALTAKTRRLFPADTSRSALTQT